MRIILNGTLMDAGNAHLSPFDRGFTLGDGVFDTLLCRDGHPLHATQHFTRLHDHAALLGVPCPYGVEDLTAYAYDILKANDFIQGRYTLRTTLSRGIAERGLAPPESPVPTLVMQAAAAPPALSRMTAIISRTVRRNEFSPLSRIKSLNYGEQILALQEARRNKADDALILNTQGFLACASMGNVFILEGKNLITPGLEDGALNGVTRKILLSYPGARQERIPADRLSRADAVFLTNSVRGIQPLAALESRKLGDISELQAELSSFLDNQAVS